MVEKGEYNATFTMYGYRRECGSIHQLAIDEETGETVREIFSLAASGMSPLKIARQDRPLSPQSFYCHIRH